MHYCILTVLFWKGSEISALPGLWEENSHQILPFLSENSLTDSKVCSPASAGIEDIQKSVKRPLQDSLPLSGPVIFTNGHSINEDFDQWLSRFI
jgi:hypothetical protein